MTGVTPKKKVKHLVIDSGAFICNVPVQDYAENFYTLPDVVREIKDEKTRESLQVLPYDLVYREPSEDDVKYVAYFAKATGDFAQLSTTDLRLIALAVRLEKELNGGVNLKKSPEIRVVPTKQSGAGTGSRTGHSITVKDLEFFGYDLKNLKENNKSSEAPGEAIETDTDKQTAEVKNASERIDDVYDDEAEKENLERMMKEVVIEDVTDEDDDDDDEYEEVEEEEKFVVEEDEGWITKDNLESVRAKLLGIKLSGEEEEDVKELPVGCITGDYAMQNVLMQMGLAVLSPKDGLHIRQTRQYVLRCHACFRINPPTATQFCKYCGNLKTLKRVGVTIQEDGTVRMHINLKRPINIRGTKYSLPMPRAGKHAHNPILCEDQKAPHQRKAKLAVEERKRLTIDTILNDPDYLVRDNPFSMNDVYSRASRLTTSHRRVVNPNETRKPTGNRKKKKNRHA